MIPWLLSLALAAPGDDFALRDGDTVVFLGDSITAARTYGKIIENYTLLRFPERAIRFYNAGQGGDTAAGALARFDRDVLVWKPTVVIVAIGLNDIGWGVKADAEHKQKYLDGIEGIVKRCLERKIRVYICSGAITAADPAKSEDTFFQKMCDEGMALSRNHGGQSIDVQRAMRDIQKRVWAYNERFKETEKKTSMHAADGVHLNDLGQLAMAFAILKGLGAPAEVSSARIDSRSGKATAANGTVTDVEVALNRVAFTRRDNGLPFNYGLFYALNFAFVPVPDQLARYMLAIDNLPPGRYQVTADGRGVGVYSAAQLAAGVNISFATTDAWQPGGPWDAQASVLKSLTDTRHDLAVSGVLARAYRAGAPLVADLAKRAARVDDELIAMQRAAAKPQAYRFVVEPAPEKAKKP
jgi:lysophospholipase L1-like esterase